MSLTWAPAWAEAFEDEAAGDYRVKRSRFRADCPEPIALFWRGLRLGYFPTIAAARAGAETGGTKQSDFEFQVGRAK